MAARYRADHIGSLLRPTELLQLRSNNKVDREQLRALEDEHIERVLQRQKDLGFNIFTDGELRRLNFMTTVVGPVRFRPDGTGEVRVFFQQWLKGKQELVWPKEFATAPFVYPAPPFSQR